MDSCVKCLINGGGETMSSKVEKLDVPIWQRYTMTIDEAAAYFHIGRARLRALVSEENKTFAEVKKCVIMFISY